MSNSIFIRPIDKERLLAIFESVDACFKIWAYGSRVNGGAHAGSDLDLALRTADLLPLP